MVRKGLELLSANGSGFEINQLVFADFTALVADSEPLPHYSSSGSRWMGETKGYRLKEVHAWQREYKHF